MRGLQPVNRTFCTRKQALAPKGVARGILRNRIASVYAPRARLPHRRNVWRNGIAEIFYLTRPLLIGFFYLTRPLLLGEAPPLPRPPLLRSGGLKAWPAGPVRANKLSP